MNNIILHIGLFLLHIYSIIQTKIRIACSYTYNNSILVQNIVALLQRSAYEIKRSIYTCRIQPPFPYWSVFCIGNELIVPISKMRDDNVTELFNMLLASFVNTTAIMVNLNGRYLLTMRVNDDTMISRRYELNRTDYSVVTEKSRKHFLSVEYTHPKMSNKIVIDLDPAFYLVGNEVFTSGFVQRCLEYQTETYIFDDDYILDIMDSKIKMITLKQDEYIVIGKTEYVKRV